MDDLAERLEGKYALGPHLPNGEPEFGYRQFEAPPIQHEAAKRIRELEAALKPFSFACEARLIGERPHAFVTGDEFAKAREVLTGEKVNVYRLEGS